MDKYESRIQQKESNNRLEWESSILASQFILHTLYEENQFAIDEFYFRTNTFSSPSTKSFPNPSLMVALMVIILVDSLFPMIVPSTMSS